MTALPSIRALSDGTWGVSVGSSPLVRSAPEPRNSLGTWTSAAGSLLQSASSLVPAIGSSVFDGASMIDLLNRQIQVQQVTQTVSMISNIARSQHETEMAPIRNMRIG